MAYVFGNAITDAILHAMPEFQGKKITLQDKYRVSLRLKHVEDKDVMVRQQVEKLLEKAVDSGWGVFVHIGNQTSSNSLTRVVVYRGKNKDDEDRDWMQAWTNNTQDNKAYYEVHEVGHWKSVEDPLWSTVLTKMNKSNLMNIEDNDEGYSIVVIGNAPTSVFEAVLTHPI
ncbi:hypothetical protein HRI_003862500 [Hibiscus trionum]|uniref:Uncharacterized protein n=1 Tax=Hibiscus trionum TaxID=183268 RepID=A0A9W7IVZ6_HIBTR|nr:hypothetical protein HRI_003862500 [Hibiscus trionum]